MIYTEAPNLPHTDMPSIFLAGGIVGCPDWQKQIVENLKDVDVEILNPRRANFPINDPNAAKTQITWEFLMLRRASIISFWFCKETMCPIVLFELGAHTMTPKPIIIGMDPAYQRRQDVEIQAGLVRPDAPIVYSIEALTDQILQTLQEIKNPKIQ